MLFPSTPAFKSEPSRQTIETEFYSMNLNHKAGDLEVKD